MFSIGNLCVENIEESEILYQEAAEQAIKKMTRKKRAKERKRKRKVEERKIRKKAARDKLRRKTKSKKSAGKEGDELENHGSL